LARALGVGIAVCAAIIGTAVVQAAAPSSRVVLDNGLTVLAVQNMSTEIAGIALVIKASAADEKEESRGARVLLQQLILSEGHARIREAPALRSAQLTAPHGLWVNTDYELVEGLLAVSVEELHAALGIIVHAFFEPPLDEESLEDARKLVGRSYDQAHSTPVQTTFELFREAFYGSGPMGRPLHGDPETLNSLSLADLRALHGEQYVASNTILCVVAPLAPAEIVTAAAGAFGGLARRESPPTRDLPPPPDTSEVEVGSSEDLGQASMILGVPLPAFGTDGYMVGELIGELLRGTGGRLERDRALLQALGLAIPSRILAEHYPIKALSVPVSRQPFLAVHALCAPSAIERTRRGLLRHVLALRTQSLSDEEMARARERLINGAALELRKPAGAALLRCRHEALGSQELAEHYADRAAAITKEDLTKLALEYFGRHAIGVQMPAP
jgi:predicted Zn-dependent peptidase